VVRIEHGRGVFVSAHPPAADELRQDRHRAPGAMQVLPEGHTVMSDGEPARGGT
jgi:hypothetical protein